MRTAVRTLCCLSAAILVSSCSGHVRVTPEASGRRAPRIVGWLHTSGADIVDSSGRIVRLEGLNVPTPANVPRPGQACGAWDFPTQSEVDAIAGWGFNSVRLFISWGNLEPTPPTAALGGSLAHHWNTTYLAALDRTVAEFARQDIAVVLALHFGFSAATPAFPFQYRCQLPGVPRWLYPDGFSGEEIDHCAFLQDRTPADAPERYWDGFAAMWGMLSGRFRHDPAVVGVDVADEPFPIPGVCPVGAVDLAGFYLKVGQTIRLANRNVTLIFEDGSDADALHNRFALNGPPPFRNEIYSYHLYQPSWEPLGVRVHDAFLRRARTWNVPLLVGEFNAFGYGDLSATPDPDWLPDTEAAFAAWRHEGVSWIFFAYRGGDTLLNADGSPRTDLIRALLEGL